MADKDKLLEKNEDEKENPEKDINDSKEIDLEKDSPDNQINHEVEKDIDEDFDQGSIAPSAILFFSLGITRCGSTFNFIPIPSHSSQAP